MRVLRATDYRRMPWKNGGGETTEVMVFPDGAGLDGFDWRVSMARVASNGPFSSFPGIDRTLAILDGDGLRLMIDDDPQRLLTPDTPPLAFAADRPTAADLIGGAVTDLNVMTRRGRLDHRMTRHAVDATADWRCDAPTGLILLHRGSVEIATRGAVANLGPLDAVLIERGPHEAALPCTIKALTPSVLYWIELRPAA